MEEKNLYFNFFSLFLTLLDFFLLHKLNWLKFESVWSGFCQGSTPSRQYNSTIPNWNTSWTRSTCVHKLLVTRRSFKGTVKLILSGPALREKIYNGILETLFWSIRRVVFLFRKVLSINISNTWSEKAFQVYRWKLCIVNCHLCIKGHLILN